MVQNQLIFYHFCITELIRRKFCLLCIERFILINPLSVEDLEQKSKKDQADFQSH
jgi:hypothetical protein